MNAVTLTESRALDLLGQGIAQENVALALGVSPSAISQLMGREEFAARVQELRFQNLQKHNVRDTTLDSLEDQAIQKMQDLLPLVMKPLEAARILQVVNGAKRRGASAPEQLVGVRDVVSLTLPIQLVNHFQLTTTQDNRVLAAGEQELITIQSAKMPTLLQQKERLGIQNGAPQQERITTNLPGKPKPVFETDF